VPRRKIDLDALERVLGRPPRKYAKSDPRNSLRARWIQRAARATGELLRLNDRRGKPGRIHSPFNIQNPDHIRARDTHWMDCPCEGCRNYFARMSA
jgi:hypothetical protein